MKPPTPSGEATALTAATALLATLVATGALPPEMLLPTLALATILATAHQHALLERSRAAEHLGLEAGLRPPVVEEPGPALLEARLENRAGETLVLTPRLLPGPGVEVEGQEPPPGTPVAIPPGGRLVLRARLRGPPGSREAGHLLLETSDPWGLFHARLERPLGVRLRSYPRAPRGNPHIPRATPGLAEAALRAPGPVEAELEHLREHQPGDDVRRIAWMASSRTGVLHVWQPPARPELQRCVFADLSRPSWWGAPGESSGDWIMRLARALARDSLRLGRGARVALFNGTVHKLLRLRRGGLGGRAEVALLMELAMYDPLHSTPPAYAERSIGLFLDECGDGEPVFLAGLGLVGAFAERGGGRAQLVERGRRAGLVIVLPTGGDPVSMEARRRLFAAHASLAGDRLLGATLYDPRDPRVRRGGFLVGFPRASARALWEGG